MTQIRAGKYIPKIDRVFSLLETIDAYRCMLGNSPCGKIVVALTDR
ncbi:hypothetical protein P0D75_34295 [Paraburkholderia sediminicola]